MAEYQSKPVTVQAVQIPNGSWTTMQNAFYDAFGADAAHLMIAGSGDVVMVTIQGQEVTASPGEYIVQEQDNTIRFYPVAPEVFERRYEEVRCG